MTQAIDATEAPGLSTAVSEALGARMADSEIVHDARLAGLDAASRLPMPTPRERKWKYLDVSNLDLSTYAADIPEADGAAWKDVQGFLEVNGRARRTGSSQWAVPFAAARGKDAEAIADNFGRSIPVDRSTFTALHYASLNAGLLVNVPANEEVSEPIRLTRAFTGEHTLAAPHTLIVTGANSSVHIIEDFRSPDGEDIVAVPVIEIVPGPNSRVHYTSLQRWGNKTRVFAEQRTITQRESEVESLTVATGAQVLKYHIESSLEGRGSGSNILGLGVGNKKQHHDIYTIQEHIGEDTRSDLLIKSALDGAARAVYYGLTRVGLKARRSDANQENRNLLLSKHAKADSDPVLEILTNDVIKCAHGATAGPVDEEQLYYLATRGLNREAATDLLVWAFLSEVLDRIPDEKLREELATSLQEKLEEAA